MIKFITIHIVQSNTPSGLNLFRKTYDGKKTSTNKLNLGVHFLSWDENENFDGWNGEGGTDAGGTDAAGEDLDWNDVAAKDAGTSAVGFGNTSAVLTKI